MNETDFLQRIRERQSSIVGHQSPHPGRFPRPVRTLPADWIDEFSRRLTAVGGHAYLIKNASSARQQIHDIIDSLRQKGIPLRRAVITSHSILHQMELDTLLPHFDVEAFPIPHPTFRIQDADLGVTGVEYAVASSGTLVVAASPQHPRSASLLPLVHIAVVGRSQLLPDLAALADKLHQDYPERPSSGIALITGPSRTADIEQTLSIGVHGPGELHVLIIDD
ncbi:MAG: lactate utilization protein [Ardenticatenaceae bacterium]|nr:lactate utilization protein [Ardenticatenaceae bacterium]